MSIAKLIERKHLYIVRKYRNNSTILHNYNELSYSRLKYGKKLWELKREREREDTERGDRQQCSQLFNRLLIQLQRLILLIRLSTHALLCKPKCNNKVKPIYLDFILMTWINCNKCVECVQYWIHTCMRCY